MGALLKVLQLIQNLKTESLRYNPIFFLLWTTNLDREKTTFSSVITTYSVWQSKGWSGTLSYAIGSLTMLTRFSLTSTRVTGSIPSGIGNLQYLERLELGSNKLTGSIPASIGNLPALRLLWLGGNQLSGAIPTIKPLQYLSLLPNQFTYPEVLVVPVSNFDKVALANFIAQAAAQPRPAKRHLLKRQQSTLYGETAIKYYCPLDAGITKEIVGGCLAGLVQFCLSGEDLLKCHSYYSQALANSKRYSAMGRNCPRWRAGPNSPTCATDIQVLSKELEAYDPPLETSDKLFPISLRDNIFKSVKYAPCQDGAYQGLKCIYTECLLGEPASRGAVLFQRVFFSRENCLSLDTPGT